MEAQIQDTVAQVPPVAEATLLIVDDDEHVRRALKRVLRRSHWKLLDVPDAAYGIKALEQEPVQVVVSDYRMPGMSGVEFLRLVKERWPRIQRVLLTGQADTTAIEEAVNQSEIFRFIWKPWDDSYLMLTVQSALDHYRMVEENEHLGQLLSVRNAELERSNRDLDEKLEARSRALVRAADEWRTSFDAIGDPLVIIRNNCEVQRANAAFARAAKVQVNQLPALRCVDHNFGSLPCPTPFFAGSGTAAEREISWEDRIYRLQSFPLSEGASVVVYKDVTEERAVTRHLIHAEKMAAVGQLAGGVAHEINNPLGGILAFAQIMSREERAESDLENLRLITDAAMRAKRIVESLLRFSRRPKEHERGSVDLSQVADDALFLLQPQLKEGHFEVVRQYEPAVTLGNANQLQQIVLNLVVNALQAMGKAGRITIEVGPGSPGYVQLSVLDTGPGIPPEIAKRIFEPFFTTKPEGKGTGLGLSICYQIAEEHGGSIRVEPGRDAGSRFVLELPAAPPKS